MKPKDEAQLEDLPQYGGRLELVFEDRQDVMHQKQTFLPSSGLFVHTAQKPKPFSEFDIVVHFPNGKQAPPVPARLVHIAEVGPDRGMMLQLLNVPKQFTEHLEGYLRSNDPEPAGDLQEKPQTGQTERSESRGDGLEKRLSVQQKLRQMNPTERAMLAAKADRMTRSIMIRDHEPQVIVFLLKNPRLTRQEVTEIARANALSGQAVELICSNTQWIQHEDIRFHLVMNPKSPLPIVLRLLNSLNMKHLRELAKNHNIKTQIKRAALRLVVERAP